MHDGPEETSGGYNARRAVQAAALIVEKGRIDIAWLTFEGVSQHDGVFHGHDCTLGQVLKRCVRSVSQQGDVPVCPVACRQKVVQQPVLVQRKIFEQILHFCSAFGVCVLELVDTAVIMLPLLEGRAFKRGDVVHDSTTTQAVLHQVASRTCVHHHRIHISLVHDVFDGYEAPIHYMACVTRSAVLYDAGAGCGPKALYTDHAAPFHRLAMSACHGDTVRVVLVRVDFTLFKAEPALFATRFDERRVQVAPVHDEVA